jgi:hypothetical protein
MRKNYRDIAHAFAGSAQIINAERSGEHHIPRGTPKSHWIPKFKRQISESYVVSTMPNRASLTHIREAGWVGGGMATYDRRKFVLDFWVGILLSTATVLAVALVMIMPYVF